MPKRKRPVSEELTRLAIRSVLVLVILVIAYFGIQAVLDNYFIEVLNEIG